MITHVWDGYFCYELLADTGDGWLTVRLAGYISCIRKSDVILPVPEGCADLFQIVPQETGSPWPEVETAQRSIFAQKFNRHERWVGSAGPITDCENS